MNNENKQFGARIKEIREKRGLNQEQLAEILNMESRHISRIETGKSFTTLKNIVKIANALNVNISSLFSFEHKKDRENMITDINKFLNNAETKDLELVYKIIFDIFN